MQYWRRPKGFGGVFGLHQLNGSEVIDFSVTGKTIVFLWNARER
jgi:hypothetical protein